MDQKSLQFANKTALVDECIFVIEIRNDGAPKSVKDIASDEPGHQLETKCYRCVHYLPCLVLTPLILALFRQQAMLTLLAATLCTFTGLGLNFSFGVFQDAYETEGGPFIGARPVMIDLIVRNVRVHYNTS